MRLSGNISEQVDIHGESLTLSSAAAATSIPLDMGNYDKCVFIVTYGAATGIGTTAMSTMDVKVMEASNATGTMTSNSSFASTLLGTTNATLLPYVNRARITMSSSVTGAETITLTYGSYSHTLNYTTAAAYFNATAQSATLTYYGDTLCGSTAEGIEGAWNLLSSYINSDVGSTHFLYHFIASTPDTASIDLQLKDTAIHPFSIGVTGDDLKPVLLAKHIALEVHSDDLTTGKSHVALTVTSNATGLAGTTALQLGVVAIRTGRHIGGRGRIVKST